VGFRNPITSASETDTGASPTGPGVRVYDDTASDPLGFPRHVIEFRDGYAGRPATLSRTTYAAPGGGSAGSVFQLDGGSANAIDAGKLQLTVQEKPAGGYESVAKLVDAVRLEVPALTGPLGLDLYNAGTQGLCAGVVPPAGTKLTTKVRTGTFIGNGFGDVIVTFPGGPFPNGLVGVWVDVPSGTAPGPYEWKPWDPRLGQVTLRCFQYGSAAAVAGPTLPATILAIGW
jgi:hypothetical protein